MAAIKTNSVLSYCIFCNLYEYGDVHVIAKKDFSLLNIINATGVLKFIFNPSKLNHSCDKLLTCQGGFP